MEQLQDPQVTQAAANKLLQYLQVAHAFERDVCYWLGLTISVTDDPVVRDRLKAHLEEERRHVSSLKARLAALGAGPSLVRDALFMAASWAKWLPYKLRSDRPGKNGRDVFITENMEIAAYSLIEELAIVAADHETVELARRNRADEEAMAQWVSQHWALFVALTLAADRSAATTTK